MKDYSEIKGLLKHVEKQFETQLEAAYDFGYISGIEDGNINDGTLQKKIQEAYQNGLNRAWEYARKIVLEPCHGGIDISILCEIFGTSNRGDIFDIYSVDDVITRTKWYVETSPLKTGDEVEYKSLKYVVTVMANADTCLIMSLDGSTLVRTKREDLEKTGKHYQQIEDFMKQMRGES